MEKKYVEFNTIREDYNAYEIENGHILKVKKVLTNIYQNKGSDDAVPTADIQTQDLSFVATPVEIDTSEYEVAEPTDVTDKDHVGELKFTILKEGLNIYETKNSLIIISDELLHLYFTKKKDKKGVPIYRFVLRGAINVLEKKMLKGVPLSDLPKESEK